MNFDKIPDELKKLRNWVCWNDDKIPYTHSGKPAKSNDSSTWCSFEEAKSAVECGKFKGIGFQFSDTPFMGVDLDHCLVHGTINKQNEKIFKMLKNVSYCEISMSGEGLHFITKGRVPNGGNRKKNVEMYDSGRYFALTGECVDSYTQIKDGQEQVDEIHRAFILKSSNQGVLDFSQRDQRTLDDILKNSDMARSLWNGDWSNYPSQSEADLALCNVLAKHLGRVESDVDRFFRHSGLYRADKWGRSVGQNLTYGQRTIEMACRYTPRPVCGLKRDYDMTDSGNAERLFDMFGSSMRYSYQNKAWYVWNGKIWKEDLVGGVKTMFDIVLETMKEEGIGDERKTKWALASSNSGRKESAIKECQHIGNVPVLTDELDTERNLFCCDNGVINLLSGELLSHDPQYMQTRMSFVSLGNGEPKMWLKFLNDVMQNDSELIRFVQKAVGLSLTGDISEQCLFFLYGTGKNGKSTFLEIISSVAGMYCAHAQSETLMTRGSQGVQALQDIARLRGARMVTTIEPNEGVRMNEGLVKQLTGGDKVTARFLYGREFEFVPEFKIWLAGNHKPRIRGSDDGIWRRIRLIPFTVQIKNPDKKLAEKIKEKELPQILNWAVQGAQMWAQEGLETPVAVIKATEEYKCESDIIGLFVDDVIEVADGEVSANQLYNAFTLWSDKTNNERMSSQMFGRKFAERFGEMRSRDGKRGYIYRGIQIVYASADFGFENV